MEFINIKLANTQQAKTTGAYKNGTWGGVVVKVLRY
jgi:hypothetical protein